MASEGQGVISLTRTLLKNRNIRVIAVTGLVSGVYIGMLNAVLQLFPGSLGFSVATLGILMAVGNRFTGVTASVVQPFAGHYADVYGRKLVVIFGSITTLLSMISFAGVAVTGNGVLLLIAFLLFGLSILGGPASQAMVAESVDLDPEKMSVAYSAVFLFAIAPGVLTPYFAGVIADRFGYLAIFLIAATLESVDLYLYARELYETRHLILHDSRTPANGFSFTEALRLPKGSFPFFATLAVDAFAFGISSSIIYAMIQDKYGYSDAAIGILVSAWSLSIIASQYPATRMLLWLGAKKTVAISEFLGAVLMASWALATSFPLFLVAAVVFGVSVATWVPGVQSTLMSSAPPGEGGSIGGKVAAVRGLIAFPAPIVGGFLYQSFGYFAPLTASFVGAVIGTVMILRYLPEEREKAMAPEGLATFGSSGPA